MNTIKTGSQYANIYNEKNPIKGTEVKKNKDTSAKVQTEEKKGAIKQPEVVYEKSNDVKVSEKTQTKTIQELKAESDRRIEGFKKMIYEMLEKQGYHFNTFMGMKIERTSKDGVELVDIKDIKVDQATRLKAQEAISEGGEFSVDAVATRIMDFAKALSGGDKSKIAELREAVEKGFDQARAALGGELPDISQDTYNEVMKRFDQWENPTTETVEVEK